MILLLIFSLFAQAGLREHDTDPGPRGNCEPSDVNSCIEGHRARWQAELAAIAVVDDKLRLVARDSQAIRHEKISLENEARKAMVTAEMAGREIRDGAVLSSGEPIFPGGPRPEEIFFLRGEQNSWGETHAAERRDRLNTLVNLSHAKVSEIEPRRQNLAMEIGTLDALDASLLQERTQRGQQVNVHADMCERGCRIQFCREE